MITLQSTVVIVDYETDDSGRKLEPRVVKARISVPLKGTCKLTRRKLSRLRRQYNKMRRTHFSTLPRWTETILQVRFVKRTLSYGY